MSYDKTIQEVVAEAVTLAEKQGLLGDLILLIAGIGQLDTLELYGVATLLGVDLTGGDTTVNKKILRQMSELGLGEEFSFLAEQNMLKCNTQVIDEIIQAFLKETDERRDNLLVLIKESVSDESDTEIYDVDELGEVEVECEDEDEDEDEDK